MHLEDSSARDKSPPQRLLNERLQLVVLGFILDEAPVTDAEVERGMVLDLSQAGERDDCRNAVNELILAGLVRRESEQLWPTRPARIVGTIGGINE